MFFLFLLIDATVANATLKEYNFNSLVRSKAIETACSFLTDSQFLIPVFNDYEHRSERIIDKFRDQPPSKRNLKRIISELQKEWTASVLSSESALGLYRRSGGVGPGADLHLTLTDPETEADAPLADYLDSASNLEDADFNVESVDQDWNTKSFQTKPTEQSKILGLKKRDVVSDGMLYQRMLQFLTFIIFPLTTPFRFTLQIVYDIFSPLFIELFSDFFIKTGKTIGDKLANDSDLLIARKQLRDEIQFYIKSTTHKLGDSHIKSEISQYIKLAFKSGTAGILEESLTHLPGKSTLQLGSLLFVAVPLLIALVARMLWIDQFE